MTWLPSRSTGRELVEHLARCEVRARVCPRGRKFLHGNNVEIAFGKVRVRDFERGRVDYKMVDGNDVDVYHAVAVAAIGIAM